MNWQFDSGHTHIGFTGRHLMVATVRGEFEKFGGTVEFDEHDLTCSTVDGSSKLLLDQIDEFIFLLSGVWRGSTESPRERNPPERKSLPWPAKVTQPYYLIPPVCR